MICLGTIVNVATILVGGVIGLFCKKILSERITDTIMQGIGLAVIIIGISGALSAVFTVATVNENNEIVTNHILFMIISLAIGAFIGEL